MKKTITTKYEKVTLDTTKATEVWSVDLYDSLYTNAYDGFFGVFKQHVNGSDHWFLAVYHSNKLSFNGDSFCFLLNADFRDRALSLAKASDKEKFEFLNDIRLFISFNDSER